MVTNKLLNKLKSQFLLLIGLLCLAFNSHAAINNISSTSFDCKTLYAATPDNVYKVNTTSAATTLMYHSTTSTSTIALGKVGGRSSTTPLNMYFWNYTGSGSQTIRSVISGQTEDRTVGTFTRSGNWAGGEVNQSNGKIYVTGAYNATIQNNYQIALVDPTDATENSTIFSGVLKPLTGQASITGQVSSDMAIDANGDVYIVVGTRATRSLVRVQPGTAGNWYYNVVADLSGFNTQQIWGMAFLNGKLYASMSGGNLYEVDVLTGEATLKGSVNSGHAGTVRDLASCQVAPVIKGKIYNDTVGEGKVTTSEAPLSGINVQLWKGNTYQKTFTTDNTGEYSFIVDSTESQDYYIRIFQPQINGVNAVQTWATSDSSSVNPVRAYCNTGSGTINQLTSDGACRGAGYFSPNSNSNISDGYIYSKITMNSDAKVAEASFALTTASNYGDAPSVYNNTTAPARHLAPGAGSSVNDKINWLRLGDQVTTQTAPQPSNAANSIASHDGVKVALKGTTNFVSLQDAFLISGKIYTFQVKTTGPASAKGYLNGWIDWSSNQKSNSFSTKIVDNRSGANNGYVTFDYTVPAGSASGLHTTYARFRFSTTQGLGPNNNNLPTPSSTVPWVVDGEVEDYRLYITTGDVSVSAVTKGGTGTFAYTMSNVAADSPSTSSDSITTTVNGVKVSSSKLHAYANVGQLITITQTLPSSNWQVVSAECKVGSTAINTTLSKSATNPLNDVLTIPASAIKEGASIACTFTNGVTPKIELTKAISGTRFNSADQFTVQIKEGNTVTKSATTSGTATTATTSATKVTDSKGYTLTEVMAANSKSTLGRYQTAINCSNSFSTSTTSRPSGSGQSFTLTPAYGDNIKCTLTNTSITANISNSTIKASPPSITANGTTESTITVQLKDSNNSDITVGGDSVEIFFTDTANKKGSINKTTSNSVIATDNNNGTYSVKVTSTKTGSDTFSYKVNNTTAAAGKTATVTYTAGSADPSKSSIEVDKGSITADGEAKATITVTLRDANNNLVPSTSNKVQLLQTGSTVGTVVNVTPTGTGVYTFTVTSTKTGTDNFDYQFDQGSGWQTGQGSVSVEYTAGSVNSSNSSIEIDKGSITADGTAKATITVTLRDANNNLVPSTSNKVQLLQTGSTVGTVVNVTPTGTGVYTFTVTSTKTGTDNFSYQFDQGSGWETGQGSVSVEYTAGSVNSSNSSIEVDQGSITADGTAKATITVTLRDANNNLVPSTSNKVQLLQTGSTVGTVVNVTPTGTGVYTFTVTSTKTGTDNFSYQFDQGSGWQTGQGSVSVEYTAGSVNSSNSSIEVDKESITADGTAKATITVTLRDANNNLIPSTSNKVQLLQTGSTVGTVVNVTPTGTGVYTFTVTSTKTGTDDFSYQFDQGSGWQTGQGSVSVEYTAGSVNSSNSSIEVDQGSITADGAAKATITVTLRDANNNLIPSASNKVQLLQTGSTVGTVVNVTPTGTGVYTFTVTSTKTGTDNFDYQFDQGSGWQTGQGSVSVEYTAGSVNSSNSSIEVDQGSITADGAAKATITVTLRDANNNLIPSASNKVQLLQTGSTVGTVVNVTPTGTGVYTFTVTSTKTGTDDFSYQFDQGSGWQTGQGSVSVEYTAGSADPSKSSIEVDKESITADGTAKATITVTLRDTNNNLIPSTSNKVQLLQTGSTVGTVVNVNPTGTGVYTFTVTSTNTGTDDFSYQFDQGSGWQTGQGSVSVEYTAGSVNSSNSSIEVDQGSITADGAAKATITVTLRDANNNLVPSTSNKVQLLQTGSTVGTVVNVTPTGTGVYTFTVTSTKIGTDNFSYQFDQGSGWETGQGSVSVEYTADSANVTTSTILLSPASIVANNTDLSTVTVILKDAQGNQLASGKDPKTGNDYVVKLVVDTTSQSQVGILQPTDGTMKSNGDGTFTAHVKSTQAGQDIIGFTIDSQAGAEQKTITYTVGEPDSGSSIISASKPSITADGVSTSILTVTLKDKYGNQLTTGTNPNTGEAYPVVIVITNDPKISDAVLTTNDNGDGTFSAAVTSTKTGTDTFNFTLAGILSSASATQVTYTPGAADLTKSTINASPESITADDVDTSTITVQLKDKFNNNLTTQSGNVVITGVNIATQAAPEITASYMGNGQYTVTLSSTKTGVDGTIGFKLGAEVGDDTTSVTYLPGLVDLEQSTIMLDKDSIVANDTELATITIQLKDSNGNNVTTSGGVATLVFNNNTTSIGTVVQALTDNQNGTYTATIKSTVTGSDVIGYTLAGQSGANTRTLNYTPGAVNLTESTIVAQPTTIEANNNDTSTITVQLKDAFGNNLVTNEGTITLSTVDPAIGTYEAELNYQGSGRYTGTVKSKTAGTDTFEYTLTGVGKGTKTADVTYKVGGVSLTKSTISASPTSIVADGNATSIISVQLKDQYENNLTAQDGNLVYLIDLETGYPADSNDVELNYVNNGLYQITIKSTKAGSDNLGFKVGTSASAALNASDRQTVTYTPGAIDYSISTIVAQPTSITANDTARSTITVQLKDKYGNDIKTDQGVITLTDLDIGKPNNSDYSLKFQSNGTYTGTVTSTVVGEDSHIGFTLSGGNAGEKTTSITYTPGSVSLTQSTISASLPSITANYSDTSVITVQFKDAYGNNLDAPLTGTVALTGINVGVGEIQTALTYAGQGAYQAKVYSKVTGTDNIGFTLDGASGGSSGSDKASVTYVPGAVSLAQSTIAVNPDSIVANGLTTSTITVQLKDAYGNNLTAAVSDPVAIFISGTTQPKGDLSTTTYSNNGMYTATVTSKVTGSDDFTFSIGGVASDESKTITYTPGVVNAAKSTISASPPSIVADYATTSTITVQLKDEFGNNLTSSIGNAVSINFKDTVNKKGEISPASVNDNQDGTYSITVMSKVTGSDTFIFSVLGVAGTDSADVTYTPGAVSLSESTIVSSPKSIIANGTDTSTITVQLKDQFGNNLTSDIGSPVQLTNVSVATEGNATLTYNGGTTGSYSVTLSSTTAGSDPTIGYTLGGSPGTKTTSVTYKSGGASLTQSTITLDKNSITADDIETATVTIQLKDQYGNNTYNDEVVVLTGVNKGQQITFARVTGAVGQWVGTIRSTQAGFDTLSFTVDEVPASDKKVLTYTPGEASLTNSTLNVRPSSIVADDVTESTITVQLVDAYGNNLTTPAADTVTISIDGASAIGQISATTNNLDGTYTATVKSKVTGVDTLVYKLGNNIGTSKKDVTYTAGALSLTQSTINAIPDEIVADGVTTSTLIIQLKDQFGNNLDSNPGAVTLRNLNNGKIHTAVTYQETGRYEGLITSTTSGQDTIGYTIAGYGPGSDTQVVTYKPGTVSLKESTILVSKPTIVANDTDESIVTVQLKDENGNNLTTDEGVVALTHLDFGKLKVAMHYVSNGQYQGTVVSTKAGIDSEIRFTLAGGSDSENSTSITYTPGGVDLSNSLISATPASIVADGVTISTVTVQLRDANGNNLSTKAGEVYLTGLNNGTITDTKLNYQGEGRYTGTLTSTKAGSDTLSYTLDGIAAQGAGSTQTVTYTVGSLDMGVSTIDVEPATIVADGTTTSTITVQLKDKYGNNLDSDTGTVALTGISKGTVSAVRYAGNGAYVATISSTVTGFDTIGFTFTDSSTSAVSTSTKTKTVTYTAGSIDLSKSSIEVDKSSITADGSETATITVTLRDTNNNLIPSTSNQVQLVRTGSQVGSLVTVTPTGNGVYTFTTTSRTTGTDSFSYQFDTGSGWQNGRGQVSVEYTAGSVDTSQSSIEVDKSLIQSNGSDFSTITVTLRDANRNLITGTANSVQLIQSGDAYGSITKVTPVGDGLFKFKVSSVKPGMDSFSYEYNINETGLNSGAGSVDITYQTPLDFADKSSITAIPTIIVADGLEQSIVTVKLYQATDDSIPLTGLSSTQLALVILGGGTPVGTFTPASTFEVNPGEYQFIVTSGTVGSDNWTFTTGSNTSSKSAEVTYQAGSVFDQGTSSITASPSEIVADNVDESIVTVTLYYGSDSTKPIEKLTSSQLTLVKADGSTAFVGTAPVWQGEQSPGVYTFKVTSNTVGSDTFYFKTTAQSTKSAEVSYTAGSVFDQGTSSITANPSDIVADNVDESIVTVTLYYGSDSTKPIEKLTSSQLTLVKADGSTAFVGTAPVWQGEQSPGVYTFKVTSNTVGSDTFYFKTTAQSTKSAKVTYQAGSVFDQGTSSITASPSDIVADNVDESIVTVTLYYGSDNTKPIEKLTSSQLTLVKADGSTAFVGTAPVWQGEQSPGVYTFKVTSSTVGSDTFYFKTTAQSTKSAKVTYQAGSVFDQGTSSITASPSEIVADNVDESIVTVALYYGSDSTKPIEKLTSSQLTLVKADGSTAFVGTAPVWQGEQSPGVYTFKVTSNTVGSDTFYFKTTAQSTKSAKVAYQAGSVFDQGTSSITASPSEIVADNVDESIVTVTLYYGSDNTKPIEKLTSSQLTLVKADGSTAFVGTAPVWQGEQSPGVYTFKVTSSTVGSDTFYFKTTAQSTKSAKVAYQAGSVFDQGTSSITASPSEIVADNVDESIVTVALYYGSDNTKPIEKLTSSQLTLVKADGSTAFVGTAPVWQGEQSPGVYTFKVTSSTVGSDTFYFKTTAQSTKSADVNYTAGSVFDQGTSSITANPSEIVADNVDESIVTVTLYYGSDNTKPIEKLTSSQLTLVKADGSTAFVGTAPVWQGEQSPGVYTFKVTSSTVGSDTFHFKTTAQSTKSVDVNYTAGSVFDQGTSSITASPSDIVADNVDESIVTVALYYGSDNTKPIEKLTSSQLTLVKADGSTAFVGTAPVWQGEQSPGVYTFKVTSSTVGSDEFAFKTAATTSTKTATVDYTAGTGKFDQENSTIGANPTTIDADGVATSTVSVTMYYESDPTKLITGYDGLQLVRKDGGTIVGTVTYIGETNGVYTFSVKSATVGSDEFAFKTAAATSTKTATVDYTAGTGKFDQENSTIGANPTTIDADGVASSTVSVTMYYESDPTKLITGYDGLQLVRKDGGTIVGTVTYIGETNGVYTFSVKSATVGSDEFAFKTAATTSTKTATVDYTAGTGKFDQENSTIGANPTTIDADGVATSTVSVTMYYESDPTKLITGYDGLQLVRKDGGTIVGTVTYIGETNGVYTFSVKSATVGSDEFAFKTAAMTSTKTATVDYTAGTGKFDQENSTIGANPTTIDADGVATSTVSVTMYYESDPTKLITGYDGLQLVRKDGGTIVGTVTYIGETNGVYTFSVKSATVGSDEFAFKTAAATSTKTATVDYTAGTGKFDQENSTIGANPTTIDADGVATSTVSVTMYYESDPTKLITGYDGLQLVRKDGGTIVGTVTYIGETNGVYTFSVKSATVGSDEFAFKTAAMTSTKTATVDYTAGTGKFDQQNSTIGANPTTIDADGVASSTVSVTMYYESDPTKLITGYDGLQLVRKDGGTIVGTVTYIGETNGVYTFSVKSATVGSDEFAFKTAATTSTKTATVDYTAGTGKFDQENSTIGADPTTIDADGVATSTVSVTMYYESDPTKLVTGYDGLQLVRKDGGTIVGTVTYIGETNGVYTFSVKSATVGSDEFAFKTAATTSTKTATVDYTAGTGKFDQENSTIGANPTTIDADGVASSTVSVTMYYESDPTKLITGYDGLQLVRKDGGTIVGTVTYIGETNGVYTFSVKSATVGSDEFAFKTAATTSTKTATVDYTAGTGKFDQENSTIGADPTTIDADGVATSTVSVTMYYESDPTKLVTGYDGLQLVRKDGGTIVGTVTYIGETNGVYTFSVKSATVGSDEFAFKTAATTSTKTVTINYEDDADLLVRISTKETNVKIGDVVLFTLTAENRGRSPVTNFSLVETLPAGFSYVANSAALTENPNGSTLKTVGNSPLRLENLSLNSGKTLTAKVVLRVGAGVKAGNHATYLQAFKVTSARSMDMKPISQRASASITVTDSDPLFDESLIVGTVYEDRNGNGIQDDDEPGIPGVKIVSAEGLIITTDQYGRYHLEGILGGKWDRGRNYILKVDPASLPKGTKFVTNNPLVRRITPGIPVRFDFGVQLPEAFIMEVSDKLFVVGQSDIKTAYTQVISQMAEAIKSNNIKELVIVTDINKPLSTQREEALRTLLNAHLDEKQMPVISSIHANQEAN